MRMLGTVGSRVEHDTDEDPDHTRYTWASIGPNDPHPPDRTELLIRAINQRRRWRTQYDRARSATDVYPGGGRGPLAATPYALRHACVSTWVSGGVPPTQVADWAGHSVEVLLKVYAKTLDGHEEMARRRVMEALGHRPT